MVKYFVSNATNYKFTVRVFVLSFNVAVSECDSLKARGLASLTFDDVCSSMFV